MIGQTEHIYNDTYSPLRYQAYTDCWWRRTTNGAHKVERLNEMLIALKLRMSPATADQQFLTLHRKTGAGKSNQVEPLCKVCHIDLSDRTGQRYSPYRFAGR